MNDTSDSTDEEEFQASSEDIEIKPWDLPYWHGGPKTEKKEHEEVAEEEVDVVEPITVEELEKIRNEGYEEGFLQGLNEGREKGEKEGRESGEKEGKEEGNALGQKEGNRLGFEAGHAEGLASGKEDIVAAAEHLATLSAQFEQGLQDRDIALPKVLSQLIQVACKTIIERELEQGDDQITKKVLAALNQLPRGAENIEIFISAADAEHLKNGLKESGSDMSFAVDKALVAGSGRIVSKQSLVEFSHAERMQEVFDYVDQQCEKLDLNALEGEDDADELENIADHKIENADNVDVKMEEKSEEKNETASIDEIGKVESTEAESTEAESTEVESTEVESAEVENIETEKTDNADLNKQDNQHEPE